MKEILFAPIALLALVVTAGLLLFFGEYGRTHL